MPAPAPTSRACPAAGNRTISVAAIDGTDRDPARVPTSSPATATVDGALNDNIGLGGGITAPLVVLSDGAGGIGLGCDASDYDGDIRRHRGHPARHL